MLFRSDESWWVREIWTYDGFKNGDWLMYKDLKRRTRTPRGESFVGDLRLRPDRVDRPERRDLLESALLRIDGLRLTAFAPGTGPAAPGGRAPGGAAAWPAVGPSISRLQVP